MARIDHVLAAVIVLPGRVSLGPVRPDLRVDESMGEKNMVGMQMMGSSKFMWKVE